MRRIMFWVRPLMVLAVAAVLCLFASDAEAITFNPTFVPTVDLP